MRHKSSLARARIATLILAGLAGVPIVQAQDTVPHGDIDDLLSAPVSGAAKYEQTERRAPGSITIVTSDEIRDYGYQTLAEVLQWIRGFYVSYDRNYTYIGVRGFSRPTDYNNRILLLVDGHTTNENVYGSSEIGPEFPIDLSLVERIEIIRGPSSALYGTGGMLAVVNVILKKGSSVHGARVAAETGSYGHSAGYLSAGAELPSGLDLLGSVLITDTRGQDLYYPEYAKDPSGGVARGLDFEKSYGGFLTANYEGFHVTGLLTARQKGIPTGAYWTNFGEFAQTTDRHSYVEISRDTEISQNLVLSTRLYGDYYGYKGEYPTSPEEFDRTTDEWFGGEARLRWDPSSANRVTVGTEYRRDTRADYHLDFGSEVIFDGNFPFNVLSAYVQDEYQVRPNLALTGGVRYDRYSNGPRHASPRAAVVWDPARDSTVKLMYGEAFRTPNIYEGNYEDTNSRPNRALKPERIQTFEVLLEQKLSANVLGSVSLYQSTFHDLIDQAIDPADGLLRYENKEAARARGLEIELNARLPGGVDGFVSYADQKTVDPVRDPGRTGSLELTNSPRQSVKAGVSLPLARGLRGSAQVLWEQGRLTVQDTWTGAYVLANVTASYEPAHFPLRFELQLRNIFNTAWATPGGFEHRQAQIQQDGRNVLARVEYKF